jgi:transcriptional regulator with XRE-family HTH domain
VPKNFLLEPGNQEFRQLLERSKWTQSETARQLKVSPGLISQYMSGLTRPSSTTLTLFRMVLKEKEQISMGVEYPPATLQNLRESHDKLNEIARANSQKFETVCEIIKLAYADLPKKKGKRPTSAASTRGRPRAK